MKLFGKGGKLNIIDILIIVILLAALVFVGMKLLREEPVTLGSENALTQPNVQVTVLCEDLDPELCANVTHAVEGPARDVGGNMVETTRLFYSNKLVDGQVIECRVTEGEKGTDLQIVLQAKAVLSDGAYSIALQELRLGKEFIVKTLDVEVEGVIVDMEILE